MAINNLPGEKRPSVAPNDWSYAQLKLKANALRASLAHKASEAVANAYQRTVVEMILRRKHIEASKDGRHIPLRTEHPEPLVDVRRGQSYVSNDIRTSRYTVWDFIPKQLFFQFSRVGNFYFLCVGIPQMVSMASSTAYCHGFLD
jgi:phospholipid-translocating ATPase